MIASMVSNRTFSAFHPTVLNASVTPTAEVPFVEDEVAAFVVEAVTVAVFSASTVTPPAPSQWS